MGVLTEPARPGVAVSPAAAAKAPRGVLGFLPRPARLFYGSLAIALLFYLCWLVVDGTGTGSGLINGWLVDGFEALTAGACLAAASRRAQRAVALCMGGAALFWTAGDTIATLDPSAPAGATSPTLADPFYLAFYPFAFAAVILVLRRQLGRQRSPSWLDGGAAALAAAALCAAFAFHSVVHSTGGGVATAAVNLAYPVGDLVLFGLVIGGTALLPGAIEPAWLLVALGCSVNAVGDTFNLFESSSSVSRLALVCNAAAWPTALLLMSLAAWVPPRRRALAVLDRVGGFAFPAGAAAAGLAIVSVGTLHSLSRVAIVLAIASLAVAGVRLALSARSLRLLTEERRLQALTDELSSLPNRRHLFQVLDRLVADGAGAGAGRSLRGTSFLYIDLDDFKIVNDSFGHAVGDLLLAQLGARLRPALRDEDMLFRIGGDEFGALLFDTAVDEARAAALRLTAMLATPFQLDAVTVRISASIGIAHMPGDARTSEGLLKRADAAMYRAKLNRSAVETYDATTDAGADHVRIVEELRLAIDNRELELHYQPQLDLRSGEVVAVEALLRWEHARLGPIAPLDFIPLAEGAGLMPALTRYVLDTAFAQCARWRRSGSVVTTSVNVSASNLVDPSFVENVRQLLRGHDLPASTIVIEITETTVISDYAYSRQVISELRDLGLTVSIDDFGAGFTSLAHLSGLAVGELKLDRVFIAGLRAGNERDLRLVRSTIELGHSLNMRVVAEGIEDEETLELLSSLGCDLGQGYFISTPKPASELAEFASAEKRPAALP